MPLFHFIIFPIIGSCIISVQFFSNYSSKDFTYFSSSTCFLLGIFFNSLNNHLYVSETCNSFMTIFESKSKNGPNPGFRTIETIVFASGYLGALLATTSVLLFNNSHHNLFIGLVIGIGILAVVSFKQAENKIYKDC